MITPVFSIVTGNGGLRKAVVRHEAGSSFEVYLQGAAVTSWKDAQGREGLYLSPKSFFDQEHPIRGGIPVAFPQFGVGPLPLHGFARISPWAVKTQETLKDGSPRLTLVMSDTERTRALWDYEFALEYRITLGAYSMAAELEVANTGDKAFEFNAVYHPYFQVADLAAASVTGLAGAKALDKVTGAEFTVGTEPWVFREERETNAIVYHAGEALLRDGAGGKTYRIWRSPNMTWTVVWNPWKEVCRKGADYEEESYRHFVCVEPGAGEKNRLIPGSRAVFTQIVTVE